MSVIRATRLLGDTLGVKLASASEGDVPEGAQLGEWSVNVMASSIGSLAVLINVPTRLALVTQVLHPVRLVRELPQRLHRLLDKLGVPDSAVRREVEGFESVVFTRTVDRRFIGSLNQVCSMIEAHDEHRHLRGGRGLDELEDFLAGMVHLQLPETFPDRAVRSLLGGNAPELHCVVEHCANSVRDAR